MLAQLGEATGGAGINLEGLCATTGGGRAEVHVLVEDEAAAREALASAGIEVAGESDVLVVEVEDRPGTMGEVARKLADAGVNIGLAYPTFGGVGWCSAWTTSTRPGQPSSGGAVAGLAITSDAFQDGGEIPRRHTCEGENLSPPLSWTDAPEGTRSRSSSTTGAPPLAPSPTGLLGASTPVPAVSPRARRRRARAATASASSATRAPARRPATATTATSSASTRSTPSATSSRGQAATSSSAPLEGRLLESAELVGCYER